MGPSGRRALQAKGARTKTLSVFGNRKFMYQVRRAQWQEMRVGRWPGPRSDRILS